MLDTKKMHVCIKNNKTVSEIMEEFNISSEEEFERELRATYTSNASYGRVKRSLEKNEKVKKKESKRKTTNKPSSEDPETKVNETVSSVEDIDTTYTVDTVDTTNVVPNHVEEAISLPVETPSTLEEVNAQIDENVAILNSLERKHNIALSNKIQIKNRLEAKTKQLKELEESLNLLVKDIKALRSEYNEEDAKMKTLTAQTNSVKSKLIALNTKRETLETLYIYVYSHKIEINDEEFKKFPDSWEQVYEKIRDDEKLDSLRVKELKTLAKYIALQWILPAQRIQAVIFDSNEMEAAYNLVKKQFEKP